MHFGHFQYRLSHSRSSRQSGYMMIVVVFLMTVLIISGLAVTASITEQLKRDREEEMIHRGVQYTRSIKRYYKKVGRYPATLEALEDTNHIRFLRKRYKDPLTKDGKWVLVRYGQVQFSSQGGAGFNNSGQPGLPNVPGVTGMLQGQNQGTSTFGQNSIFAQGGQSSFGQSSSGQSSFGQSSFGQSTSGQSSFGQSSFGQNNQQQSQQQQQNGQQDLGTANGTTGDTASGSSFGSSTTGNSGNNLGQSATGLIGTGAVGGGAIIGVASMSKKESLRIVADKNHYNDWRFVYDPTLDRGSLIKGPYDPKQALGKFPGSTGIGQPAGQQPGSFGNNSFGNSFGSQGSSFNNNMGQQPQPPAQNAPPQQQ